MEATHNENNQLVSPKRLRQVLLEDGEGCLCAPAGWNPNVPWNVEGKCPEHGEVWNPASGEPHPDDEGDY